MFSSKSNFFPWLNPENTMDGKKVAAHFRSRVSLYIEARLLERLGTFRTLLKCKEG